MDDSWPNFEPVEDPSEWLPIRYWSYWDFARDFAVSERGKIIIFLCPFLEAEDSYAEYFDLYELMGAEQAPDRFPTDWETRTRPLGRLPIKTVTLDSTRKSFLRKDSLHTVSASVKHTF